MHRALGLVVGALAVITPALTQQPQIRHVFTIMLENHSYDQAFGPNSPAPYLSRQLTAQGELLANYYAIGHYSLPNYIALISGQGPNGATQWDCAVYLDFTPPAPIQFDINGQAAGQGCIFPAQVQTIADQLTAARFTWRAYMEDMPSPCRYPAFNSPDPTQHATPSSAYAVHHNPFVFFHSIIDQGTCASSDVPLTQLPADLKAYATTPNYVFISPNLCHDAHDAPCLDGEPGGLVSADAFLQQWVPQILASPAFQTDGLLLILFDESDSGDTSACCGEIPGPNAPLPGLAGPGGGRVGAVLLSKFVQPGAVVNTSYNHYSTLRTIEDLFGLAHLGFAAQAGQASFGADVFAGLTAPPTTPPTAGPPPTDPPPRTPPPTTPPGRISRSTY